MSGQITSIAGLPPGTFWNREAFATEEERQAALRGELPYQRITEINRLILAERDKLLSLPVPGIDEFTPQRRKVN